MGGRGRPGRREAPVGAGRQWVAAGQTDDQYGEQAAGWDSWSQHGWEATHSGHSRGQYLRTYSARRLEDLSVGEELSGTVKALTEWGVSIDVGATREATLLWSQAPEGVAEGDHLEGLIVKHVDAAKGRVKLGMSKGSAGREKQTTTSWYSSSAGAGKGADAWAPSLSSGYGKRNHRQGLPIECFTIGQEVTGTVESVMTTGALLDIGACIAAFLPWRNTTSENLNVGDAVENLCIERVDEEQQRIRLRSLPAFGTQGDPWGDWREHAWKETPDKADEGQAEAEAEWWPQSWSGEGKTQGSKSWASPAAWSQPAAGWDGQDWNAHGGSAEWSAQDQQEPSLEPPEPPEPPAPPPAIGKPPRQPGSRAELVEALFRALDANGHGVLRSAELRRFATGTGFGGTDEEWLAEYQALCASAKPAFDPEAGMDLPTFARLVDDDSDDGCFCPDEELAAMIAALPAPAAAPVAASATPARPATKHAPPVAAAAAPPQTTRAAPAHDAAAAPPSPQEVKMMLFELLATSKDSNGTPLLGCRSMEVLARETGFEGSADEWLEEWGVLSVDFGIDPAAGMPQETFCRLVDDEEQGLGLEEAELRDVHDVLRRKRASGDLDFLVAKDLKVTSVVATEIKTRHDLQVAVFQHFDVDNDKLLTRPELRRFAEHTGFEGTEREWDAEYLLLCSEWQCVPEVGVDQAAFLRMVDDATDAGCYCDDKELWEMLTSVLVLEERCGSDQQPRAAMKRIVFGFLDQDCDGFLSREELLLFMRKVGWQGSLREWHKVFPLSCEKFGACDPLKGLTYDAFSAFLDEDANSDGCGVCLADKNLHKLVQNLQNGEDGPALRFEELSECPVGPGSSDFRLPQDDTQEVHSITAAIPVRLVGTVTDGVVMAKLRAIQSLYSLEVNGRILKAQGSDRCMKLLTLALKEVVSKAGESQRPPEPQEPPTVPASATVASEQGKGKGKGGADVGGVGKDQRDKGGAAGSHKGAGKGKAPARTSAQESDDPWANAADPWAAASAHLDARAPRQQKAAEASDDPWANEADPWATPAAKKANERQQRAAAAKAKDDEKTWEKWEETASRPVMDASKLLEAARAANAARKAKEEAEAEREATEAAARAAVEAVAEAEAAAARNASRAHSSTEPYAHAQAPIKLSLGEALGSVSFSVARIASGDQRACVDLLETIWAAPSRQLHLTAVASTAIRSLLQGKAAEASTLLSLDELIVDPFDGDASLLVAISHLCGGYFVSGCGYDPSAGAPLMLKCLPVAISKLEDKAVKVRDAAQKALKDLLQNCDRFAFELCLPALLAALEPKRGPFMKLEAMRFLAACWQGRDGEAAIAQKLPQLLPAAVALLSDTSAEVRQSAEETVDALLAVCGNTDLQPHLQEVLQCAKGGKDVTKCVRELAEVVFVQQVDAPAMAVVLPVLTKGLRSRSARTQRQASIIAENMCRLVSATADVQPFLPHLLPLLEKVSDEASDPDVRRVAGRARDSLCSVADEDVQGRVRADLREALAEAEQACGEAASCCPAPVREVVMNYIIAVCASMGQVSFVPEAQWARSLRPLLVALFGAEIDVEMIVNRLRDISSELLTPGTGPSEEDAESEVSDDASGLCSCTVTLACGAATLLTNARLRLGRGRVYGLVGANDSGKSTLLRAIHERKLAGFPPTGALVSALVEHGVGEKPPECNRTPLEFLFADPYLRDMDLERSQVSAALQSMGFDQGGRLKKQIRTLSGGWRMKLGLVRAMLQEADLLLLDEPTGHLDADHITWLADYINGLRDNRDREVTSLIVSHDAPFLDRVCTHIIHVHNGKLRTYQGNFSSFMQQVPDAQLGMVAPMSAAQAAVRSKAAPPKAPGVPKAPPPAAPPLADAGPDVDSAEVPLAAFALPDPGSLPGLKSRGKRFLFLEDVFYSYPASTAPAVRGATVECCLKSRVGILGPNGAGKSTLAALVVGELAPDTGSAWRHPNLRVAFVAQHAFHHLEKHLDLTATQYLLWRFEGHEDREALDFRADEVERADPVCYRLVADGQLERCEQDDKGQVTAEVVLDRRQRGRLGFEYEVRWRGRPTTTWVSRRHLADMGCLGMAKREDERQAAQHALSKRPLTTPAVEAHLAGFGLGAEEASHRRLGALSNGQRARVVLGAATWLAPHLLVLDEPTNYLDRPALVALTAGLRSFEGGVMVISHTMSFVDELCTERWVMEGGRLRREGEAPREAEDPGDGAAAAAKAAAAIAASAAKDAKDKKKMRRLKELRRKNGEEVSDDSDGWYEDLLRKAKVQRS